VTVPSVSISAIVPVMLKFGKASKVKTALSPSLILETSTSFKETLAICCGVITVATVSLDATWSPL
jgi:hypothetical protein